MDAELERQGQINDQIQDRVKTMDGMEQAALMQDYMMKNPEEAMKLMQQNHESTASTRAVLEYMKAASDVFAKRQRRPDPLSE